MSKIASEIPESIKDRLASLTSRQREIYDMIVNFNRENGYGLSVRELCEMTGIKSPNGICSHLKALVKKGVVLNEHNVARSIRPVMELKETACPVCGRSG